jgi:hypothetical protein
MEIDGPIDIGHVIEFDVAGSKEFFFHFFNIFNNFSDYVIRTQRPCIENTLKNVSILDLCERLSFNRESVTFEERMSIILGKKGIKWLYLGIIL